MNTPEVEEAGVSADRVADERLLEILAGCEGATPGPWTTHAGKFGDDDYCYVTDGKSNLADEVDPADAAHIARLDPQTVASIVTELLALRTKESSNDQ